MRHKRKRLFFRTIWSMALLLMIGSAIFYGYHFYDMGEAGRAYLIASIYMERGSEYKATKWLDKVISLEPENAKAYLMRGNSKVGEYDVEDTAFADYEKALTLYGAESKKAYQIYCSRGNAYLHKYTASSPDSASNLQQSIQDETSAIALAEKWKIAANEAYLTRGLVYERMGEKEQALSDMKEAVQQRETAEGYYQLGELQEEMQMDEEAIASYSKSIEINPSKDNYEAYRNRMFSYQERGEKEKAQADYEVLHGGKSTIAITNWVQEHQSLFLFLFLGFFVISVALGVLSPLAIIFMYGSFKKFRLRPRRKADAKIRGTVLDWKKFVDEIDLGPMEKKRRRLKLFHFPLMLGAIPLLYAIPFVTGLVDHPIVRGVDNRVIELLSSVYGILYFIIYGHYMNFRQHVKDGYKEAVIPPIIANLPCNASYNMYGEIAATKVKQTGLLKNILEYHSEDKVYGTYRTIDFETADVQTVESTGVKKRSKTGMRIATFNFYGRWMIFDFQKNLASDVYIYSKKADRECLVQGVEFITLDNPEFNHRFEVYAQNKEEAFYILTPHFLQYMMELEEVTSGAMMMAFYNGQMHVALDNKSDGFEINIHHSVKKDRYIQAVVTDLQAVLQFIEHLRLDRSVMLYGDQANIYGYDAENSK